MRERKYTRMNDVALAYECTNKKCKWQGLNTEWVQKHNDPEYPSSTESCCPNCGNNEFYGLLELPTKAE